MGYYVGCLLAKIDEIDMRRTGLTNNWDKSDGNLKHERLHLGFDVDLAAGLFKVPIARWEALRDDAAAILIALRGIGSKLASSQACMFDGCNYINEIGLGPHHPVIYRELILYTY